MSETKTPTEGELHFSVPGMKCGGCAGAIDQVVRRQTGIRDLKIDVATKEVKLSVDPKTFDQSKTLQALSDAGYPAQAIR